MASDTLLIAIGVAGMAQLLGRSPTLAYWLSVGGAVFLLCYGLLAWWRVFTAADGSLQVKTTGSQGSGVLRSMAEANGLMVLHHAQGNVAVGDEVDVMMFDGAI